MSSDTAAVRDIVVAGDDIVSFTEGVSEHAFAGDSRTQCAVLYKLLMLSRAAARVSPAFRAGHPAVPWSQLEQIERLAAFGAERRQLGELWRLVTREVPLLVARLRPLAAQPPTLTTFWPE